MSSNLGRTSRQANIIVLHAVGLAATLLVGAGALSAAVYPAIVRKQEDQRQAEWLVSLAKDEAAVRERYRRAVENRESISERTQAVLDRLEPTPEIDGFLTHFSQLVQRCEASIQHLQPLETELGKQAAVQRVRCRIAADWESLVRVLAGIEDLPYVVWVDRVRFASATRLPPTHVDLDLAIVFAPADTALAQIARQLAPKEATP